jgi:integrase
MPATGRWCLWAPTAPADRGLAGLRPSRVDLLAGAVTVAETLTEVKGKLIAGPPKTRAGRRTVGLPPFVVRELEEHLAAAQRPGSHVFTAAGGGRCGSRAFGRALGCRLPRQPACRACASTTFATPPWRCGSPPARRPRRSPCAGHTSVSFTLDRYGHQTIPWPIAEGRCHPVTD